MQALLKSRLEALHEGTKLTIQQLKVTLLRGHESEYDPRPARDDDQKTRLADRAVAHQAKCQRVAAFLGEKGYGDQKVRTLARDEGIRPIIKHREFSSLHKAWNARLDVDLYGQRSQNETVNSRLKRKYSVIVRSRHWWKQFRELTIACLAHNLDRLL